MLRMAYNPLIMLVSIRAPVRGAIVAFRQKAASEMVSIRAPVRGAILI